VEFLNNLIGIFSPKRAAMRAYWQLRTARLYEAAGSSIYHKKPTAQGSGDKAMDNARGSVRDWARYLDENHDLAIGVLDELVNKVVGTGITLEPLAASAAGKPNQKLNREISKLWRSWSRAPEVTGELPFSEVQRLAARTWFRDGECLAQHVLGNKAGVVHTAGIPYSIEMIEADYLPFDFNDEKRGIIHGVEKNAWGRPRAYHLLKTPPDDKFFLYATIKNENVKRVLAERISHIKFTRRFKQTRGISVFHGVAHRLDDVKDYEESERIAARIDASFAGFIRKGSDFDPTLSVDSSGNPLPQRSLEMQAGMIFDDLLPGEDIGTVGSNRPNSELTNFRNSQLKAIAAGTGTSYSSVSRNYDGTYSAQRQELVESIPSYARLRAYFISAFLIPVYRNFINAAILSGALRVPAGVDIETVFDAEWIAPPQSWIDPKKEIEGDLLAIGGNIKTEAQVIRERTGKSPDIVKEQVKAEKIDAAKLAAELAALAAELAPEPEPDDQVDDDTADENDDEETAA